MSYLQRFPYEQLRQLQSDVETLNQLVSNLTKRLNDATQYFVTDIDTSDSYAPFPTSATFTALTYNTLSPLDDNGLAHDVETELAGLALLAGATFTENVGVEYQAGTLSQRVYNA